jgi:HlyD family secretion protein
VEIETAHLASALLVPLDAVHDAASARPWVLKVEGGRARRQDIALGLRSRGWCEVTRGLRAGDRVIDAPPATVVADGARVRPVEGKRS